MTDVETISSMQTDSIVITSPQGDITIEDAKLIQKIKAITARGNDVEIRQKRDGNLAIYEIRKKIV